MSQAFDRAMALLDMPGVRSTRPSTIVESNALLGHAATHVVQTACQVEEDPDTETRTKRITTFLQVIDAAGVTQVVIPHKVAMAIFRQIKSASAPPKRQPTKAEREAQELRKARALVKKANADRAARRQNGGN